MTQNAFANARNAVIKLSGTITGNQIVTVPNGIEKTWIISNGTTGAYTVNFKYASTGTGQTWSTTDKGIKILYADGTDIRVTDLSTLSGQVVSAQIADFAVNTAELATNAVTAIKITQSTITQAKLASDSVGATQIIQSTITQAKLAANSVGSNQLISTAVTPASYTLASITVDADGRITAASSGAAGGGGFIPTVVAQGPASGTFTASPTSTKLLAYGLSGGGGGGNSAGYWQAGGTGGTGLFGIFSRPIAAPFSQPYVVGGPGPAGGAGGATNVANFFTINAATAGGNGMVFGPRMDGPPGPAGSPSNVTSTPGTTSPFSSNNQRYWVMGDGGAAGGGGGDGGAGGSGGVGKIMIYEA
jgi:hypothetical protein